MNNKTRIYIYIGFLFILTFLLAKRIILNIKSHDFEYLKIIVNIVILAYVIFQVIKLGKIENDKDDSFQDKSS